MATPKANLLGQIANLVGRGRAVKLLDWQLLERFAVEKEQAAFNALVQRHGPMVLCGCRRVLHNDADAEDAFQATFLVLARKAATIGKREALAAWLHKVAFRVALRARSQKAECKSRETKATRWLVKDPLAAVTGRELLTVLDEELQALPEKSRAPLILCYLEERTRDEAARQLNVSVRTLQRRLELAREMLRRRLVRRGVALPAAFLATGSFQGPAQAALPGLLVASTAQAAMQAASGAWATTVSARTAQLVSATLKAWAARKALTVATLLVTTAFFSIVGFSVYRELAQTGTGHGSAASPPQFGVERAAQAKDLPNKPDGTGKGAVTISDLYGDPLPKGALARLGTVRLRHPEGIEAVAFSPDDKTIACAAGHKFVSLWDRSTGQEKGRLEEASGQTLAFSPDGRVLATAGGKQVELWDVATGKRLRQLACQTFTESGNSTSSLPVVPLVFSVDGRFVASANAEHVAVVWDALTGREVARTAKQPAPVASLRFLPDAKTLIALSGDRQGEGAILSLDVATAKEIGKVAIPQQKTRTSRGFAISPDGKTAAVEALVETREKRGTGVSVYWAHSIRLLDVATGQERRQIRGKNTVIGNVVFAPDGRSLAWSNMDNEVTTWDLQADKLIHRFRQSGGSAAGSYALAYDRHGKTLAAATHATALQLFDLVAGKELLTQEAHGSSVRAVVFARDGSVISASDDQTIRAWDAKTGKPLAKIVGHESAADAVACSGDGRYVATAATDRSVRLWDAATGHELHRFTLPDIDLGNGGARSVNRSLAFTPDSRALLAAGSDLKSYKWDVASGKELHQRSWSLSGGERPGSETEDFALPVRIRFSPDCRTAVATSPKAIHLIDVASGRQFATAPAAGLVMALAFAADSRVFVTGGWDKILRVWEAASAHQLREIKLPDYINSVAVSGDGRLVAAGCGWNPASIHLFDVLSGKEVLAFEGLSSYVGALDFAADGKTLVSGHRDSAGLIWDVTAAYRQTRAAAKELDAGELERLWADLGSDDAANASAAAWTLKSSPKWVPAFLKGRLAPVPRVTAERLHQLILDLDDSAFAKRQAASQELSRLGTDTHGELRKALEGKLSLELRRRIEALLSGPTRFAPALTQLQRIRAIGVLEAVGGQESIALLRNVAQGAPAAPETQEAKSALDRIGGQ
jgi:RNA polymerase sigma factor (sigma-70 family)